MIPCRCLWVGHCFWYVMKSMMQFVWWIATEVARRNSIEFAHIYLSTSQVWLQTSVQSSSSRCAFNSDLLGVHALQTRTCSQAVSSCRQDVRALHTRSDASRHGRLYPAITGLASGPRRLRVYKYVSSHLLNVCPNFPQGAFAT